MAINGDKLMALMGKLVGDLGAMEHRADVDR